VLDVIHANVHLFPWVQIDTHRIDSETYQELRTIYNSTNVGSTANGRPGANSLATNTAKAIFQHLEAICSHNPNAHKPNFEYPAWEGSMDIKKEKEDKGVFDPGVGLLKQDEKFFDNSNVDAMHINEPDERLNLPRQDVNEPTDIALKLNRRPIHSFKAVESVGVVQHNTGYEPQDDALPTRQPLSASALQLHEALNGYSTPLTFAQLMPSRDGEERDIRSDVAECGELPLGYVQGECMEEIGKL